MNKVNAILSSLVLCIGIYTHPVMADEELDGDIASLQNDWANANYNTAKDAQEAAFKTLAENAQQLSIKHAKAPEALIWEAIVNAGYAKAKGGIGALKFAEKARDLLFAAEKINPESLQGSVYTSLGSLFYKVPGWPIGFGDKKKAKVYLEKALKINPTGIDPNFFYADFLSERGEYAQAIEYYKKSLTAPARLGREVADSGRRAEAEVGLKVAQSKL
ncbi:MAG: tetratricopeptide repeat protein [Methylophilaceae bacterium]